MVPTRLSVAAIVAALGLSAAGTAAADVTMSWSGGGFIGRGDVIANGGKGLLVETGHVVFHETWVYSGTCVRSDGSRVPVTYTSSMVGYWLAHARHAPGNGTITGYTIGPNPYDGESNGYYTPSCGGGTFLEPTLVSDTAILTFADAFSIVLP
jgi:hypothetical protein